VEHVDRGVEAGEAVGDLSGSVGGCVVDDEQVSVGHVGADPSGDER